jgi:hypothetical protein
VLGAGRPRIDDAGDALLDADAIRGHQPLTEQPVAEHVGVQVDEARRNPGAIGVDQPVGRPGQRVDQAAVRDVQRPFGPGTGDGIDDPPALDADVRHR